jgi:hypothetical protein
MPRLGLALLLAAGCLSDPPPAGGGGGDGGAIDAGPSLDGRPAGECDPVGGPASVRRCRPAWTCITGPPGSATSTAITSTT